MNEKGTCTFTQDTIESAVPSEWKYKVINKVVFGSPSKLEVCLKVALFCVEDVDKWIEALEEKTQCSYSIQMTKKTVGEKVLFKRRYHCRLKTKLSKTYTDLKSGTRNTKCPSRLSITLMNVKKKKFRGKFPPDPEMPCIVDYVITHNHSLSLAARFRKVNKNVREKLNQLFSVGHSASTAYEMLRIDAQINNPNNYEELLANRAVCPDRNFCHKFFNDYKKENGIFNFKDNEFLINRLQNFNKEVNDECTQFQYTKDGHVAILCPPLFKRVHANIISSAEVVFIASINPADQDCSKAFFLTTHSDCGALPLGIIITSSENADLIATGLNLLKLIVGKNIFHKNEQGPELFILDDCEALNSAINSVWPASNVVFCSLHILHSLWRYLLCSKNGIIGDQQLQFFKQFRNIMYANNPDECDQFYKDAVLAASDYPDYIQILRAYWKRRTMWAVSYRSCLLPSDNAKISDLEKMMCILREPICHRMRSFNILQLVDFLLTKFVEYYNLRLLDAANGAIVRDVSKKVSLPNEIKTIDQIDSYLYWVPNNKLSNLKYYVNIDIVACTCLKNITGYVCNHINWLLTLMPNYQDPIIDSDIREIFHKTAFGLTLKQEDQEEKLSKTRVVEKVIIAGHEVIKLEIVNEEEIDVRIELKESLSGPQDTVITEDQALQLGKKINQNLFNMFEDFLMKSPLTVGPVLQKMLDKTKTFITKDEFVSACENFTQDSYP